MKNRKHISNQYLQNLQNTSPAKTTYSFSKGQRFSKVYSPTPNKFYDYPTFRSRRATSLGFGQKTNFINKATNDPGLYQTKGTFQLLKIKAKKSSNSTFGQSHENIFNRYINSYKNPGPGKYTPQNNIIDKQSKFYMGQKINYPENFLSKLNLGPQTYKIENNILEKLSKFKATKSFRIKTQIPVSKTKLQFLCGLNLGPGAYNPEKMRSIEESAKSKTIRGSGVFSKQQRLKWPSQHNKLGPGSYSSFSVFGDNLDYC